MATSTFDSTKIHLSELLSSIRTGGLQLPEFQRGWIWDDDRILDLLASVARGFPIGAVMLMETGGDTDFEARPVQGAHTANGEPELMILDGQQRLTSLFQSLFTDQPVETEDSRNRAVERWYYIDIRRALKNVDLSDALRSIPGDKRVRSNFGRTIEENYTEASAEHDALLFPLRQAFDPVEWRTSLQEHHDYDRDVIKAWNRFESEILQNFSHYQLPVITLKKETPREAVCLVFEKVNTGGVALDVFELLTAMFAAEEKGFNLRDDWENRKTRMVEGTNQREDRSILSKLKPTDFMQAVALLESYTDRQQALEAGEKDLRGVSCKKRDVLELRKSTFDRWADSLVDGFIRAARFLHGEYIFEDGFVPYRTQLVPLATLMVKLGRQAEDACPRSKLRRWYWCGVFGELYGSATESRFANDVMDVITWIRGGKEPRTVVDSNFAPERLESLRTRNSAAYRGLYSILLREGARDWRTGELANIQNYYDESVDIHHIFPRKWCRNHGIDSERRDSIVNKTPLTARTNRIMGGDAPGTYLEQLEDDAGVDPGEMDQWLASHMVDPDALRHNDFEAHWNSRRRNLLESVREATGKDPMSEVVT